jgi:hypothetical protein
MNFVGVANAGFILRLGPQQYKHCAGQDDQKTLTVPAGGSR